MFYLPTLLTQISLAEAEARNVKSEKKSKTFPVVFNATGFNL